MTIQIYTEMGTHVSINALTGIVLYFFKLLTDCGIFRIVVFAPRKTGEIESEMCQQSAIKCPDEIYPVDRSK